MLIAIIGNPGKPDLPNAVRALLEILDERGVPVLLYEGIREELAGVASGRDFGTYPEIRANATYAIAFGGDGTMLGASRMLAGSGIPLVGVNLGKLGFLAEFSVASLAGTMDDLLAGRCRIVERALLQATFPDLPEQEPIVALNDIVFDKRGAGLMMQMETFINGDFFGGLPRRWIDPFHPHRLNRILAGGWRPGGGPQRAGDCDGPDCSAHANRTPGGGPRHRRD